MNKSLLFIPDISGYTKFIQSTEIEHSQHVISELLEILLDSNMLDLEVAEIEGDAIFFFKEEELVSTEMLLAQVEAMFTAFYSHLKLLETNRICPCRACAIAPKLELKIVAHCGELQFIHVHGTRKPFGSEVIEVHRLLKNSVKSNNYFLISNSLKDEIGIPVDYESKIFDFNTGSDEYDNNQIGYLFSEIESNDLHLKPFKTAKKISFDKRPNIVHRRILQAKASNVLEYLSNYKYRHNFVEGVDEILYNEIEVTRLGTEHRCVIKDTDLDFITVTKEVEPGKIVYGEFTNSPSIIDELYQFYIITPRTENECELDVEVYWKIRSPFKKLIMAVLGKKSLMNNVVKSMDALSSFIDKRD